MCVRTYVPPVCTVQHSCTYIFHGLVVFFMVEGCLQYFKSRLEQLPSFITRTDFTVCLSDLLPVSPFLHLHSFRPSFLHLLPSFNRTPSVLPASLPLPSSSPLHPSSVSPHLPVLDRTVKIWDLSATTEVAQLGNHASYVRKVAFCEQSKVVFSASQTTVKVCWWK